jgi:hypothetical protein
MSLSSTVYIEAALYNEHTLVWEPFIEPAVDSAGRLISPWGLICSITPVSPYTNPVSSSRIESLEKNLDLIDSLFSGY